MKILMPWRNMGFCMSTSGYMGLGRVMRIRLVCTIIYSLSNKAIKMSTEFPGPKTCNLLSIKTFSQPPRPAAYPTHPISIPKRAKGFRFPEQVKLQQSVQDFNSTLHALVTGDPSQGPWDAPMRLKVEVGFWNVLGFQGKNRRAEGSGGRSQSCGGRVKIRQNEATCSFVYLMPQAGYHSRGC